MDKIFVVARLQPRGNNKGFFPLTSSSVIRITSCYEKAKDFWVDMGGEFLGGSLIIQEMPLNDKKLFNI